MPGTKSTTDREIRLHLLVRHPPAGVRFAVQRGPTAACDLVPPVYATIDWLSFEIVVRLGPPRRAGPYRFLGPFVHGSPDARFVYLNSGQAAGDPDSCWMRRAKVWLEDITAEQIDAVLAEPGAILEAEVDGSGRDGGPVCASTRVVGRSWRVSLDRPGTAALQSPDE